MFLHPWDFPGKSTGVGCHFLLQRIFLTQGSNPGLPHCRQTLYRLSHQESPCCTLNPHNLFRSFYLLTTFTLFTHWPPPLATTSLFSVSSICVLCLHFKIPYISEVRAFVFLCLTYFTKHNALKVHPCFLKWQDFILFNDWIIFHLLIHASVNT